MISSQIWKGGPDHHVESLEDPFLHFPFHLQKPLTKPTCFPHLSTIIVTFCLLSSASILAITLLSSSKGQYESQVQIMGQCLQSSREQKEEGC
ncbi:hypothetical protein GYH30_042244 [Glycine max]|uniref:Uncharacterized protein n=1 Tax=Glycine max TaxID=3847 RepID=A0A0R0GB73_SOYBN|nr:hypothetical protein GYH30_042244 [Glycine max]